jgi:hypothetical protein
MPKYAVVTTFHAKGYNQYAQKFLKTFNEMWPKEVTLYAYAEDCKVDDFSPNIVTRDLHGSSPELVKFKETWKNVPKANGDISQDPVRSKRRDARKGFKWDAIRFAHKVYSIFHCAKNCDADILIWMDADMVCHSPITIDIINSLIPQDKDLCFLGREGKFSECGLYSMNLNHKMTRLFLDRFQQYYDQAEKGIFTLEEWHDSYVFDDVRTSFQLNELNWSAGLIKGEGHPLINSPWGAYLDHLKGERKSEGKSRPTDLIIRRGESYWQST